MNENIIKFFLYILQKFLFFLKENKSRTSLPFVSMREIHFMVKTLIPLGLNRQEERSLSLINILDFLIINERI
jgi:hypothetical protein